MSKIINATSDSFSDDVLNKNTPVLVDFWATWCAPCKAIAPVLEDLSNEYDGKVVITKVDVTANEDVATKYNIRNIPALLMFKGGEVVDQMVGAHPRSNLVDFIEKHI